MRTLADARKLKVHLSDIFAYFFMLFTLTLVPGPLNTIMMARTLAGDTSGAIFFGLGIALGDVIVIFLVVFGLGTWLEARPMFFNFSQAIAIAYILWLSWCIYNKGMQPDESNDPVQTGRVGDVAAGLLTCVMSPQTLLLYLVLLPALIDLSAVDAPALATVMAATFSALAAAFLTVIVLAGWLRPLLMQGRHLGVVNRCLACLVATSGVWIGLS
ncbi:Threonine/homoserine/homoserine lactone efflux protein [Thalassovita litoralis]|jgi:threonine/homoserine/homoserine lactone efflux protein|uniref:Threonine/homoserine/homoserine lactone efflux protein n=1 Tax=Thalassovita litoralis TaxID=1010611 RepID=A0A521FN57_9RHOB|nr:Threonine/homoserine/homoserine lactone efflux protein [Thalassovita litoralis]